MLNSIPGLYPLDANNVPPLPNCDNKVSLEITKYTLVCRLAPSREPCYVHLTTLLQWAAVTGEKIGTFSEDRRKVKNHHAKLSRTSGRNKPQVISSFITP